MATRNMNPYSSGNNIGFGARATTGGTYENPRLGIEDMSAFSRGVASTFRLPEKEKTSVLDIPDVLIDSKRGNEWYELDGNVNDLNQNFGSILNNQWKNDMSEGGAGYYYNMYKNAKKGSPEQAFAINAIKEYERVLGPNGFFSNYLNTIGDGTKVDKAASNVFLPGLNGTNTSFTIASIAADSQNNPQNWKYGQKRDKFGQLRTGLIHNPTGEFIDVSAMDGAWVDSNIAEYYDYESNILSQHDVVKNINFNQLDVVEGKIVDRSGNEFMVKENSRYYDKADFFNFEGQVSAHTNQQIMFMESNGMFKSAFRQVNDLLKNREFNLSADLKNELNIINQELERLDGQPDRALANRIDTWRKAAVADYYNEQFKLRNGSDYYGRDDRAVLMNENFNSELPDTTEFNEAGQITKLGDNSKYKENDNFGRSIARTSDNIDFFERDISDVQLREQKGVSVSVSVGDGKDDVTGGFNDAFSILDEQFFGANGQLNNLIEGPLQQGAGAQLLDLNNSATIETLQRSIQGIRGVTATLQTRNDLKQIIGKNILATNQKFANITTADELEGDLKVEYERLVEKTFNDQMSADPDAELIFYDQSNNKVIAAGRLDNKMYYGEDIVEFLKQFAKSSSQKKSIQQAYEQSDRYDIDQLLKKAVESGSNEGLNPEQIKTANWIRSSLGKSEVV
jgi:hypothetical protein|tara:strand:- start:5487 stop:7529 length:2043 start_codon:yes stop_codon:yes gene_type:complete